MVEYIAKTDIVDGLCPMCGEELDYGLDDFQDGYHWYDVSCQNEACRWKGRQWDKQEFDGYTVKDEETGKVYNVEPSDAELGVPGSHEPKTNPGTHPDLIDACENLITDLAEAHAEERDAQHYGDNPEQCLYCRHIKEAQEAIKAASQNIDSITVEVCGGVAYCDDPRVEIIDHDDIERKRG